MNQIKTYVWSVLGRLTHWLIATSFIACYISSFYENYLTLHLAFGIFLFFMLLMKIVWGLIGPRYARWSDYKFSFADLKFYFKEKLENRYRKIHAGHNPASSWFSFLITWIGIICCLIGFLLYGIQEARGIFSYLNSEYYLYMEYFEYSHVFFVYVIILMIFAHVSGVLIEQFYHKTNMVMAMVSGYKKAKGENIKTTFRMNYMGSLYILSAVFLALYVYGVEDNIFIKNSFSKIDYQKEHKDFHFECSDCHNLIAPHLLPKASWIALMEDTKNHYEEDLELEEDMILSIKNYLLKFSAETSTREASFKFYEEIKDSKNYTLTKTQYWKNRHKMISNKVFKSNDIESKSNCVACHKNFEQGLLTDEFITFLPLK